MSSDLPAAPEHTHCQNCGTALQGSFCHVCGQRDIEFHRSFHYLVHEAIETWLHVDRSIGRGCFDLLFRPGRMTSEFNEGRRASHVPPLRFYLVISLLFFLMVSLHSIRLEQPQITIGDVVVTGNTATYKPHSPEGTFSRWMEERIIASLRQPEKPEERFVHRLPKAMALCVPLFALFSRLLFWRGPWRYLEHLILAIHLHSFAFLWIMVATGYTQLVGLAWPTAATLLGWMGFFYAVVYFFASLRHTLGAPLWTTVWKGTVLVASYCIALAGAVALTILLSLFWA
jgi:cellulose synthase/poly-beta-1,6-N-acetylglucosamine synthase-like glycosyltransferase